MNADAAIYLDSSALVKLVVVEPESDALIGHMRGRASRVSCALACVEVLRAVRGHGQPAIARARQLLQRISLLRLDDELLDDAGTLHAGNLRSLAAIHLAGARALGDGLADLITYDRRMADAAETLGLPVFAPA